MSVERISVPVKSKYYNMRIREGYDQNGDPDILSLSLNTIHNDSESSYDAEGGLRKNPFKRRSNPRRPPSEIRKDIPGYQYGDLDDEFYDKVAKIETRREFNRKIVPNLDETFIPQFKKLSKFHKQFEEDAKLVGTPEIKQSFDKIKRDYREIESLIERRQKTAFVAAVLRYIKLPTADIDIIGETDLISVLKEYFDKTNLKTINRDKVDIINFPGYILKWFDSISRGETREPTSISNTLVGFLRKDLK